MESKTEVRRLVRQRIAALSMAEREAAARRLLTRVTQLEAWQQSQRILLYEAMPDEVDTALLIAAAHSEGKQVLMPEPSATAAPLADLEGVGLAIVPGRAFTPQGDRLGRGKGYYDRMLGRLSCPKIGVGFCCQQMAELPTDPWDVPLDGVILV